MWNWPLSHGEGEDHFVIVLGGLHIEMVALKILGDWLEGSGWMEAIVQANIASCRVLSESFNQNKYLCTLISTLISNLTVNLAPASRMA